MATNERIRQIIRSQEAPYPPQGVLWVHEVEGKQVKEVWKNGGWYPVETISLEEIWDLLDSCYYPLGDKKGALPEILEAILANSTPIELGGKSLGNRVFKITKDEKENLFNAPTVTVKAYQSVGTLFRNDAFNDTAVEGYFDEISDFLDAYGEQLPEGESYDLTTVEATFVKKTYTAYNKVAKQGYLMVFGAMNSDTGEVEWFYICCGMMFN